MSWATVGGNAATNVGASGLHEWASGDQLAAADLLSDVKDAREPALYGLSPGVLEGGACTAAANVVSVPAGTVVFARSVWSTAAGETIALADGTSYVWLCGDGVLRTSGTASAPTGWTLRSAALLCKAVTTAGISVVDLSVQQRARYADVTAGVVLDNRGLWAAVPDTLPAGCVAFVPANHQMSLYDRVQVSGRLALYGRMRVSA